MISIHQRLLAVHIPVLPYNAPPSAAPSTSPFSDHAPLQAYAARLQALIARHPEITRP